MNDDARLLDSVALTRDRSDAGLRRGQVGTIVEVYADPAGYEVEFVDPSGETYAVIAVSADELLVLRYRLEAAG
jgi:hypothetical protein